MIYHSQMFSIREYIQILWITAADRQDKLFFQKSCLFITFIHGYCIFPRCGTEHIASIWGQTHTGSSVMFPVMLGSQGSLCLQQFEYRVLTTSVITEDLNGII